MKVKHYMTKDVITVTPKVKVTDAVDIMEENKFHRLPVVQDGKFYGLITEELIAENSPSKVSSLSIYEMNYLFDKMLVEDVMKKDVTVTYPDVLIEEAAMLMIEKDVTVLPVVDEAKNVIGIVTHKDIFKALIDLTGFVDEGARVVIEAPEDRVGIFAKISQALAAENINLTHVFVNRPEDNIEITLQTSDLDGTKTCQVIEDLGYDVTELE